MPGGWPIPWHPAPSTIVIHIQWRTSYGGLYMALGPEALHPNRAGKHSSFTSRGLAGWSLGHMELGHTLPSYGYSWLLSSVQIQLWWLHATHVFPLFLNIHILHAPLWPIKWLAVLSYQGGMLFWPAHGLATHLSCFLSFSLFHVVGNISISCIL